MADLTSVAMPIAIVAALLVCYTALLVKFEPKETGPQSSRYQADRQKDDTKTVFGFRKKNQEKNCEQTGTDAGFEVENVQKKNNKEKDAKKAFYLFGEKDFEGCPHQFGHLASLRKNAPIPDECFGCPQILECLAAPKTKSDPQFQAVVETETGTMADLEQQVS